MLGTKKIVIAFIGLLFSVNATAQDLKLWYKQPAVKWTEALPIGNGRIGAMVFGGVENDRIQFNEETLWTGEPRNYSRPGAYKYLDSIRNLLFAGKQKEAEALAEEQFMGMKSGEVEIRRGENNRPSWIAAMESSIKGNNPTRDYYDISDWKTMTVPSYDGWEAVGFEGLDGAIWLRKDVDLPEAWNGKDLVLDLNRIRDYDKTYINGIWVGGQQDNEPRKYIIPAKTLHAGINKIAIQVLNFADKGGIMGYKDTTRHIGIYPIGEEGLKLSLNGQWKYFIQNDNPPPAGVYQASYQPFGDLFLKFNQEDSVKEYRRELDISTAIATTSYVVKDVKFKREYFISQPNQVMAVQLTASQPKSISFEATLSSPHKNFSVRKGYNVIILSVQVKNGALKGESFLHIRANGGKLTINNDRIIVTDADEASLYLTAATNYINYADVSRNPEDYCNAAIGSITGKSHSRIRADHIKEFQQYFNTFSINLGKSFNQTLPTDERLKKFISSNDLSFAALYTQYGRYLLISSSRPGTRPANLQGIWNDLTNPPWGSKYTTNINAEMNYWPAELLNLSPLHEPLFRMIEELAVTGKQTAKDHYDAPGWVLHHNTDIWRGTAPINAANHGIWVTGGAWLCQHLWEHYLFTQDKTFLKNKAYPIMKEAALFFNHFLIKDPVTGYLISTPSNSPEQGGLVAGPTMDHQIIRNLFSNVIAAGEVLNTDAALRNTLAEKIKQIAPNKIGKHGQLQEWMEDKDDPNNKHRHISHLWGMYPGNEINYDATPEMMNAAKQSLLFRGDEATGWSLGWKINCWARFKDAEHAFTMIKMLLSPVKGGAGSYPNLFDAHPPFQIDGNFGGAAGIGEMIVQSHTKYIDILPALPAAFANGEVKGICARGGFVMNIKWTEGKLQRLTVTSKAGLPLVLRYNGKVKMITTTKNGVYQFDASLNKL